MKVKAPFMKEQDNCRLQDMANQDNAMAMNDCAGLLLLNGDIEKAVSLFERAAMLGSKKARSNLRRIEQFSKNRLKS